MTMEIMMLRFDAPLMSFGGVMVDQHGPHRPLPRRLAAHRAVWQRPGMAPR